MPSWAARAWENSVTVEAEDSHQPLPPMGYQDSRRIRGLSKMPQVVSYRPKPLPQGEGYSMSSTFCPSGHSALRVEVRPMGLTTKDSRKGYLA